MCAYGLPCVESAATEDARPDAGSQDNSGSEVDTWGSSDDDEGLDDEVLFKSFDDYWGGDADVDYVTLVRYDDSAAVLAALEAGDLDAVIGAGVLEPAAVHDKMYEDGFDVQVRCNV